MAYQIDSLDNIGRGLEVIHLEGSINDIQLVPGTSSQAVILARLQSNYNALIEWAETTGNTVWLTTILQRTTPDLYGGSISQPDADERQNLITDINTFLRTLSSPCLSLSDIDLVATQAEQEAWIDLSNPPHPDAAGAKAFCRAAITSKRQT